MAHATVEPARFWGLRRVRLRVSREEFLERGEKVLLLCFWRQMDNLFWKECFIKGCDYVN